MHHKMKGTEQIIKMTFTMTPKHMHVWGGITNIP